MRSISLAIIAVLTALSFSACKKSDNNYSIPAGNGKVKVEFSNSAGSSSLNLGDNYVTENGNHVKVTRLAYYISNVKLSGSNVNYAETESYHLIDHNAGSMSFDMSSMPYGSYTSITFTLGVDSLRNVSGAQTGDLDPAKGMFWSWNTGYIMFKMEGTADSSTALNNAFEFHVGGFDGATSAVRTITLALPNAVNVTGDVNAVSHIHVSADIFKLLKAPHLVRFGLMNTVNMPGTNAVLLADNYAQMFSVPFAGL